MPERTIGLLALLTVAIAALLYKLLFPRLSAIAVADWPVVIRQA